MGIVENKWYVLRSLDGICLVLREYYIKHFNSKILRKNILGDWENYGFAMIKKIFLFLIQ